MLGRPATDTLDDAEPGTTDSMAYEIVETAGGQLALVL
jgi:hypothetical protein